MRKNLHSRLMLLLAAVLMGVGSAWAGTSTLTFTAAYNGSGTANDGVAWTVESDGTQSAFDGTKGIHYGTGSAAVQYIQLSTSGISGTITKIVVNASTASGVSATVGVTVGGQAFGGDPQTLSSSATDYTFTGSASGAIVVTVTKPLSAAKALYVKSVAVTFSDNSQETTLTIDDSGITNTDIYRGTVAGTLTATVSAGEAALTGATITWSSSDRSVATVDANGAVTLVAAGTTTITASYAGETGKYEASSATLELTVADSTPETTLTIDDSGITNRDFYVSTAAGTLTATVYAGNTPLTNPTITWSSSNTNVATVNNGVITLVAAGTTTITASYAGEAGQYKASSATYVLTVTDSTPRETIDFTKQGYSNQQEITTASGQNCTITFDKGTSSNPPKYFTTGTAVRAYGGNTFTVSSTTKTISQITITFSSGEGTNEITVSEGTYEKGTWTGNAQSVTFTIDGTSGHRRIASITVTYADESDTRIATTVTIDATGITNTDVYTNEAAGTLTATVAAGETTLTNPAITWSSSNEDVATVASNGAVTLVAAGTTTITASYAGEEGQYRASSATYELTVTDSTPASEIGQEEIVFEDQNYTNGEAIESVDGQNCTITFDKGTNSNVPKYYDTGTAIRAYGGNTFTVSSTTKTISQITITFSSGEGTNEITASEGTYAQGTWTGNARSVTFTIGGTTGHRRIASITVTYAPQNYRLFTGELVEGDYIIYSDDQDLRGHVMNNTTVSSGRLQDKKGIEVEPDDEDVISTNDATIVWHIAKSGEYWTIYNAEAKAYAASTGNKEEARMLDDGTDDKALWTVSRTEAGTYEFVNKFNAAKEVNANLRYNGTDGFACYATTTGGALSLYKKASVTVTDAGWATYITEENVHFGDDVNAYIVTGYTETSVKLTKVKDVVKGTPVIVNANAGTYVLENAVEVDEVGDNKLVVYHAEDGLQQGNLFVLAKDGESACFKQWVGNNNDLEGRVVLPIDPNSPNGVRALSIVFGDTTTGIETVSHATPTMSEGAYTLSGQRVQKPTKGLYIVGGKKVVVK